MIRSVLFESADGVLCVRNAGLSLENPMLLAYGKRIGDSHAPGPRFHY